MKFLKMPEPVSVAINTLKAAGFEAFIVGGCVRDIALHRTPSDWDITTSALPNETELVFGDYKIIETGIKHGTVTVIIDGMHLEITTYRKDGDYIDNRHPADVSFTKKLEDDLCRRDFTVNAMAYSENDGLIDLFGGTSDLDSRIIRTVGEPDERFTEDALRIMRALRFSAVLDFDIEEKTKLSILKNCELLKNISAERITDELFKFLCGDGERVTQLLIEFRSVIAVIIPEIKPCFDFDQKNKHHIYDVYTHMAYAVGYSEPAPEVRLALLLHDIGKPECFFTDDEGVGHFYGHGEKGAKTVEKIAARLKLPSRFQSDLVTLVRYHDYPVTPDRKTIKRRLNKFGPSMLKKIMLVKTGDSLAHNTDFAKPLCEIDAINESIEKVLADEECFSLRKLCISGKDLLDIGFTGGPEIGHVLDTLLNCVIDEKLPNEHDALLEFAKDIYKNGGEPYETGKA